MWLVQTILVVNMFDLHYPVCGSVEFKGSQRQWDDVVGMGGGRAAAFAFGHKGCAWLVRIVLVVHMFGLRY